jgi:Caspase domain
VILGSLASASAFAAEPAPVRLAVVVSSNTGLPGEAALKYADQDARRVSDVLYGIGGVLPGDVWLVSDATVEDVFTTLGRVTVRAQDARSAGRPVELVVFYAGHAGSDGLHLGGETLPLPDLKAAIRVVPASDRVVVLDACHAGTIASSRGTSLVEVSDGYDGFSPPEDEAWIVSSGPEERSFEVEDRKGALFTHYFLSGARGAADVNGDHRVTLQELYGFVQVHTVAAAATLGQRQQPRWAGELGELALTDLSISPTGVRVVGPVPAPLLVVDVRSGLVQAEVPQGAGANLALEPGPYQLVSVGTRRVTVGSLVVPADGWTWWEADRELGSAAGVRTRGGLYDLAPWGVGLGYVLAGGALGGGPAAHGVAAVLHRDLGRGHRLDLGANGVWAAGSDPLWSGRSTRAELSSRWTREIVGRHVVLAGGAGLVTSALWTRVSRTEHPLWGTWFGGPAEEERDLVMLGALEAAAVLRAPVSPGWTAEALAAVGPAVDLTALTAPPTVRGAAQVTLHGAFR